MATQQQEAHKLLRNITHELFQTETSASRHSRREAARIPDTPPAAALLAVAQHAERSLSELRALAAAEGLPVSALGVALGAAFSEARQRIGDHFIERERSYRGTLLGIRHGTDVVRMVALLAKQADRAELASWCDRWLEERTALLSEVEAQLSWFAQHVHEARQLAQGLFAR